MRFSILVVFLMLASFFISISHAAEGMPEPHADFKDLRESGKAVVTSIIDPQTVQLSDKRIINLAGLNFPDLDPYNPGPVSMLAVDILRDMLQDKKVTIFQTKKEDWGRSNRLGHQIGHIVRDSDGVWVQGTLLDLGLARVMTSQRNPEMAAQMYKHEQAARTAKLGIWEEGADRIVTSDEAEALINSFQIVEGKIESAALKENRVYLNFGKDWRTDFTVSVAPGDKRLFTKQGIELLGLNGKTIRVRGWIRSYNGPYMEIDHPEALELKDAKSSKDSEPRRH